MHERITKYLIGKVNCILSILHKSGISKKVGYDLYHKWIMKILANDFDEAQRNTAGLSLNDDYVDNKIWVMWWQGLDDAPSLVINNVARLYSIFGRERVIVISRNNYMLYTNIKPHLVKKLKIGKISFTLWSDIVRYNLLLNNGGVWIDSTVVLSKSFLPYLKTVKKYPYFSICSTENDHQYISECRWTGWLIGGKRNYELFRFVTNFFDIYYQNHDLQLDYFLVDDAVNYFYLTNEDFRLIIDRELLYWDPYLFVRNYNSTDYINIEQEFENKREFSVQKFSNKISSKEKIPSNSLYGKLTN